MLMRHPSVADYVRDKPSGFVDDPFIRRLYKHFKDMKALALAAFAAFLLPSCATRRAPDRPPELAGQAVPNENIVIDFTKRYDLVCQDADIMKTYQACRVLGYTGDTVRDPEGTVSKAFVSNFSRWLAIKLPDGRRVFLSPSSIRFMEETAP